MCLANSTCTTTTARELLKKRVQTAAGGDKAANDAFDGFMRNLPNLTALVRGVICVGCEGGGVTHMKHRHHLYDVDENSISALWFNLNLSLSKQNKHGESTSAYQNFEPYVSGGASGFGGGTGVYAVSRGDS